MFTALLLMAVISSLIAGFSFISSAACINQDDYQHSDPMSIYWLSAIAFALVSLVCFSAISGLLKGTLYWLIASLFSTVFSYGVSFVKQLNAKPVLGAK